MEKEKIQIADEKIEQLQANGGMSAAAMEAEIVAEEKAQGSEIEENVPYEMPIEVVERSEMLYAGSDKTSGYTYQLRVDDGLRAEIAPELRDLKENEHLFVEYRKWENGEENDYDFSAYIMQENDDGTYSSPEELNTRYNRIRIDHLEESESVNAFKAEVRGFVEGYEERQVKNQEDLSQFDKELSDFASGNLSDSHVFNLGKPGEILKNCGFPPHDRIELSAARLRMKAEQGNHPFDFMDITGLDKALQNPIAVFEYGDKTKSQNVIVNLEKDGKNFLVGVFFNQQQRGYEVSDIRGLFNRDNMDWIRWIQQGKMIYGDKDKIQVLVAQQRTNPAEVNSKEARTSSDSYYLDSVDTILQKFGDVKDVYTKDFPEYAEQKERFEIFKQFRNAYQENESINVYDAVREADEFYNALKNNDKTVIEKYINGIEKPELAESASLILQNGGSHMQLKDLEFSNGDETHQISAVNENEDANLEQKTLNEAADLLKNMSFNSENYKDLLEVINKISSMNGLKNLEVPKEEDIAQKSTESQNQNLQESAKEKISENQEAVENENVPVTTPFDPKAPIVYGETKLPAFAVMADGKLKSVENAVVEGFDKTKNAYMIDSGSEKIELPKATLETLLNDKREQEQIEAKRAEGRTIVFEDKSRGVKGTVIPEFAMYTAKGLETFKDFVPTGFNKAENSYTLSNGDRKITVTADRFKEITAPGRFENHFDENSPAWKKLCETQYNDFFQQRDNTAYNFRHNLSVYCRKEANSPCDAMHLAKSIIQRMPKEEQKKTEKLLDKMAHENESMAELITRIYHESIKEMPLNEDYMKKWQPKNVVARPFYDTISDNGKKIEDDPALVKGGIDRNLKIGDTIKNIDIQTGKIFGSGKDSVHFDSLKVVSASKEGNSVTLMDANKSYFKLPRDTVLQFYKEQQQREMKHEHRQNRSNSMTLGYI